MADLLDLSSRIIDSGVAHEPVNRVTQELSELADGVALVESFSHVALVDTGDGLVAFDTSGDFTGAAVVEAIRSWTHLPIRWIVYTHGHVDHVGGSRHFAADARRRGDPQPEVIAHVGVLDRLERYRKTNGWNLSINRRQFGGSRKSEMNLGGTGSTGDQGRATFVPADTLEPDTTYETHLARRFASLAVDLHHDLGETDDHTWTWIPSHRAIAAGDFVIWNFPNAGNPQKVQRYPEEWAAALRAMLAQDPELLIPAHGLPIVGRDRIRTVLGEMADILEWLTAQVLEMMNAGATLDEIVHSVHVPAEVLARPFLRPLYDEPEFMIHNVWRRYGGWWDGEPSRLKPAPDDAVATEVAALAGGPEALARRALTLAEGGDLRLACHLADWAGRAAPGEPGVHANRAEIYRLRRTAETSLMAKGIFTEALRESRSIAEGS